MAANILPTLEYIQAIKVDIADAIISRGGELSGIPFEQWGSILAGLVFDEDTVQNPKTKPVKATPAIPETPALPVVTPHNPTDLPFDFDIRTSGLTPIAVGFAYGSLQFDFTGAVGSVEGNGKNTGWAPYTGPLFTNSAEYIEAKRMDWMDAVDSNPEGIWVSRILWEYSGTGSPPYSNTVSVYIDEARENQITSAMYSNGKFYSQVDVSFYTIQSSNSGDRNSGSIALIKSGICAPIVDLNAKDSGEVVSPNWDSYPVYCYGDVFVMWDGNEYPIDSADRCALVAPTPEPEPIVGEYKFTINGQPQDVMTGIGTFNEVNGTFTGKLRRISNIEGGEPGGGWCGSDASCAWFYANYVYRGDYNYITVGVENLPVTLC